jgi:hypothetical protein
MAEAGVILQGAQQAAVNVIKSILFHHLNEYETEPHIQRPTRKI